MTTVDRLSADATRVVAEDTYRVTHATIPARVPHQLAPLAATLHAAVAYQPAPRGTILYHAATAARPAWIEAILYDFDRAPPCERAVVEQALGEILALASRNSCAVLAIPLDFGCQHGGIRRDEQLEILVASLQQPRCASPEALEVTLLVEPAELTVRVLELDALLDQHGVSRS